MCVCACYFLNEIKFCTLLVCRMQKLVLLQVIDYCFFGTISFEGMLVSDTSTYREFGWGGTSVTR